MELRRARFASGSFAKNLIGSLIGAIDEDSRCGFPFSRLLEEKTFSHTLFRSTVRRTNAVNCTAQIYQRKAANSKIFPRNSKPIRNTLPSLFLLLPFADPFQSKKTHSNINRPTAFVFVAGGLPGVRLKNMCS